MFIVGELVNPLNPEWALCTGTREYAGEVITVVDQIAYFAKVGKRSALSGCGFVTFDGWVMAGWWHPGTCDERSPRPTQEEFKRKAIRTYSVIRLPRSIICWPNVQDACRWTNRGCRSDQYSPQALFRRRSRSRSCNGC